MNISDLKIHHIGVAVASIARAAEIYAQNGYVLGEKIFDPLQNVNLCLAEKPDEIPMELAEPAGENSSISEIVAKNAGEPMVYHICYAVADIEKTIADLNAEKFVLVKPPVPATAYGNVKVAFLHSDDAGLIKLLEKA